MQTFEAAIEPDLAILGAACALAGLAVGAFVYLFSRSVRARGEHAAAALDDMKRRHRGAGPGRSGPLKGVVSGLAPVARALPLQSVHETLVKRYARAGWPGGLDDGEVAAVSLLIGLLVACLVTMLIFTVFPLAAPLGLLAVVAGPGVLSGWLNRRAASRDMEITRTMPFVLDLLVLTMRAGAPFNVAMERVAIDYAAHPIGTEFRGVLSDMEMGVTKNDALESLAKRNPIPAVRIFADDLNQAEELGRPVADTLQRLSDRARERRILDATESAGRAKVLVLIPGMLVFLAALILLFSPFAVRYFYGGYTGI
ncbi:MAG: type II secretion system F family protein [Planctomycetota bacterium]|jgi:tight adherence protein C